MECVSEGVPRWKIYHTCVKEEVWGVSAAGISLCFHLYLFADYVTVTDPTSDHCNRFFFIWNTALCWRNSHTASYFKH